MDCERCNTLYDYSKFGFDFDCFSRNRNLTPVGPAFSNKKDCLGKHCESRCSVSAVIFILSSLTNTCLHRMRKQQSVMVPWPVVELSMEEDLHALFSTYT